MKTKIFTSMFLTSGWQPPRLRGGWPSFPLILILFLPFAFCLLPSSQAQYADGDGSPEFPFQIAEPNQLIYMSEHPEDWDKHFLLTADLNLALADPNTFTTAVIAPDTSGTSGFQGTHFTGTFDGNGYTISNLTIDDEGVGNDYLGLFGWIQDPNADVKNLGLENVNINSGNNSLSNSSIYVGSLCGYNFKGSINNCYASGSVTGGAYSGRLGGLCGINSGNISNCYATGLVTGGKYSDTVGGLCGYNDGYVRYCYATASVIFEYNSEYLGGLVGKNLGGTIHYSYSNGIVNGGGHSKRIGGFCGHNYGNISSCYATGSVSVGTVSERIGGLCGGNSDNISNCYATGSVTSGNNSVGIGGLCGTDYSDNISNCYFLDTAGPHNGHGSPLTDSEMKQQSSFVGWDFVGETTNGTSSTWIIHTGEYPSLYYFDTNFIPYEFVGQGTESDPYLIFDANDLGAVWQQPDGHFQLQNDLDLIGISWSIAVIPDFTGVFDGNGCTIANLIISGGSQLGLIGIARNNAIICNLGLKDVDVIGGSYSVNLGSLCGENYGNISMCYATGSVTGIGVSTRYLGGLCGYNQGGINNCYSNVSVTGGYRESAYLGSLCGYNFNGSISHCYSTGSVSGEHTFGGLCGSNNSGIISNCYFLDTAGPDNGNGEPLDDPNMMIQSNFVGWDFDPDDGDPSEWLMPISNYPILYWQQKINYYGQPEVSLGLSDSCSIQIGIYSLVEESLNWTITGHESCTWITNLSPDSGVSTGPADQTMVTIEIDTATITFGSYVCELALAADNGDAITILICVHVMLSGSGTSMDPFLIEDFNDFQEFADSANVSIYWASDIYTRLECNLNLDPNLDGRQIYTTAVIAPGSNNTFKGVFDGNDHTISNLTIDTAGADNDYLGLFGQIEGFNSEVKNLGLENLHVTGGEYSRYIGGLCGVNHELGTISECYVAGSITSGKNSLILGGLCGSNRGSINCCYANGSITGGDYTRSIGGLVGDNNGIVSNCYANGSIDGQMASRYLGGLCGYNLSSGNINNCYSTGSVIGINSGYFGGLCGRNQNSISECYFLDTAGPDNGWGTPLDDPNMRMQSSFVSWDFVGEEANGTEDHWKLCIDGYNYPRLTWQFINPADFLRPGRVDQYDLFVLTHDWLTTDSRCCDINPNLNPDGIVNLFDYREFSRYWLNE